MNGPATLRGLYAITTEALCRGGPAVLLPAVQAALRGGTAAVQYRDKWNEPSAKLAFTRQLSQLCASHGIPLIINDDVDLAARAGAAGVHLGARDGDVAAARRTLGPRAIVGATCGSDLARALAAQSAGASYVSFGRFFDSRTKPEAPPAEPGLLGRIRPQIRIPACVIGGLTPANAGPLVAAGADLVAAAGGLFDAGDIEQRARDFGALFTTIPR